MISNLGGETGPPSQKMVIFLQPLAVKLRLAVIFSMSWGFPSIHVADPFSSVLQVLFIIL